MEGKTLPLNRNTAFLLAYRAIAYERFAKAAQQRGLKAMREALLAVRFDRVLPIVACSAFHLEFDLEGKPLQRLGRAVDDLHHVTLTVTAFEGRTVVVFGWIGTVQRAAYTQPSCRPTHLVTRRVLRGGCVPWNATRHTALQPAGRAPRWERVPQRAARLREAELDEVEKELAKALVSSLGSSVTELSELLADKLRYLRWKSAVRTLDRAREFARARGGLSKAPPLKFFLPFMENCSLEEDDDEVVDLWARLLVEAAREFKPGHLLFMRILREITGSEARLLRAIAHSTGAAAVSQSAIDEAVAAWEMFSAPASPLKGIDISGEWEGVRDFVFQHLQMPGVAIEHLGIERATETGFDEIASVRKNETVFDRHDQVSIDILASLNVIARVDQEFRQVAEGRASFQLAGTAYCMTAMGAAFYASCAPADAIIRD